MYTWMDATLKELSALVKEVNADARKVGTKFEFSLVFPELKSPQYRMREIGKTVNGREEIDDNKTLAMSRFQIGDYLDVAITLPSSGGFGSGGGNDRDNFRDRGDRGFGGRFGGGGDPGRMRGRNRFNGDGPRGYGGPRGRNF